MINQWLTTICLSLGFPILRLGDKSKDVYDGLVDPSAISRGAYWFHVHIMDLGLRGRLGQVVIG